jgi:hypothetical protein
MGIQATCPYCQEKYNLRPQMQGKEVRCRKCAGTFPVGGSNLPEPGIAGQLDSLQATAGQRLAAATIDPTPPPRSPVVYIALIFAGVVLFLICVGGGIPLLGMLGILAFGNNLQQQAARQMEENEKAQQEAVQEMAEAHERASKNVDKDKEKAQNDQDVKDRLAKRAKEAEDRNNRKQKEAEDMLPPGEEPVQLVWQVPVDPAPVVLKGPFNLTASIGSIRFPHQLIVPSAPSPFVAVGSIHPPEQIVVHDLRQMQPVGQPLMGKFNIFPRRHVALSPDGAYVADRAQGTTKPTVDVWSVAEGRSLRKIEVDAAPNVKVGLIDFAGPDRLLTMKHEHEHPNPHSKATYQVWNIKTGACATEFSTDLVFNPGWGCLSPGHRYLAMEETKPLKGYHILCWDLETGKLVGTLEVQKKEETWGRPVALAFSADGAELALLWWRRGAPDQWGQLLCWDVKTGKKVLEHNISRNPKQIDSLWSHGGPRTLQWLPDNSGWLLFDHLVFDRKSGAVVWKLDPEPRFAGDMMDRRLLDADHITTIAGKFEKKLTIERLPREQIDAAIKKAREQAP